MSDVAVSGGLRSGLCREGIVDTYGHPATWIVDRKQYLAKAGTVLTDLGKIARHAECRI